MNKKELASLYFAWAKTIEMSGESLPCYKLDGRTAHSHACIMVVNRRSVYEFPLAYVEDKPVFVGDKLYIDGELKTIVLNDFDFWSSTAEFSWNPPKSKMITIGGVEFIAPSRNATLTQALMWKYNGVERYYIDLKHARDISNALDTQIIKMLDND